MQTTLHPSGYPRTRINQEFELADKVPQKERRNPKKHNNEKTPAYVTSYNKTTKNYSQL